MAPTVLDGTALDPVRRWLLTTDQRGLADVYDELRAAGPLVPTPWGSLLVTGHRDCARVLTGRTWLTIGARWRDAHRPGWRHSPSTVALCRSALQTDPPRHARKRHLLTRLVAPRLLPRLEPVAARRAEECLRALDDRLRREGTADAVAAVCRPLPAAVLAELLDLPPVDLDRLGAAAHDYSRAAELVRTPGLVRRADAAAADLTDRLGALIDRHRRRIPPPRWCEPEPGDALDALLTLFGAGVVTTSALLGSVFLALLENPGAAARIGGDPGYADRFVDEVLRWDPPARVVTRVASAPAELAGTVLPEGRVVHVLLGAAHRDPEVFGDPHAFDPGRPPGRLLAFGAGAHYCVGAAVGRAQAVALARGLARRVPGLRLAAAPRRRTGPNFADLDHLPVAPRIPACFPRGRAEGGRP
ncbi:cytochrome P450 [Streptomyces glaucosporus]|uniref:Cytochrome P450 n=1 Tax=Streptomyces glaucosporus TaxID=284044 RepID=A0ABN3IS96_9ACTN